MTGFNHGMTGAVIALTVKNPIIALPLAFVSHFIQDAIPHYGDPNVKVFGRNFNTYLILDFLFSVFLMVVFGFWFPAQKWLIWACMIAAASPDLMWAYYRLYVEHIKKRPLKLGPTAKAHSTLQWSQTPPGAIIEAVWFIGTFLIIWNLK